MKIVLAFFAIAPLLLPGFSLASASFTLPSGVRVDIVEARFEKDHHRIFGCTDPDGGCRINGRVPFGVRSNLPETFVRKIKVTFRERSYFLDAAGMYDAWGDRPLEVKGAIRYFGGGCVDLENCQFRGIFSDGAATFVSEWRIVNGHSFRTVLTDSSDVVDLFMRHIDPPN